MANIIPFRSPRAIRPRCLAWLQTGKLCKMENFQSPTRGIAKVFARECAKNYLVAAKRWLYTNSSSVLYIYMTNGLREGNGLVASRGRKKNERMEREKEWVWKANCTEIREVGRAETLFYERLLWLCYSKEEYGRSFFLQFAILFLLPHIISLGDIFSVFIMWSYYFRQMAPGRDVFVYIRRIFSHYEIKTTPSIATFELFRD